MDFKDIIFSIRAAEGLSQDELAQKVGVSKSTVSMWESGIRMPSRMVMTKISNTFHIDLAYLYGQTEIPSNDFFKHLGVDEYTPDKFSKETFLASVIQGQREAEDTAYLEFMMKAANAYQEAALAKNIPQDEIDLLNAYRNSPDNVKQAIRTLLGLG